MTLASLGWGAWWVALFLRWLGPEWSPGIGPPSVVGSVFAAGGLGLALFAVRAQRSWLMFILIPLMANASLLVLPWMAKALIAGRAA